MTLRVDIFRKSLTHSPDVLVDGGVLQLSSRLNSLLQASVPPSTTIATIRSCLKREYGKENVQQIALSTDYKLVWDPEQGLIMVCCDRSELEVRDGEAEPLLVQIEVGAPYEPASS